MLILKILFKKKLNNYCGFEVVKNISNMSGCKGQQNFQIALDSAQLY